MTDLFADRKGNVYFSADNLLYLNKPGSNITEEKIKFKTGATIKLLTADKSGIVYFLTKGNTDVKIYQENVEPTYILDLIGIKEILAVDSFGNIYFKNEKGTVIFYDLVHKYLIKSLLDVKTTSIATDYEDNAIIFLQTMVPFEFWISVLTKQLRLKISLYLISTKCSSTKVGVCI